ncbi:GNAT family N-acetyltransferase [Propionibacteriaceae bacterium Y1923]
MTEPDLEPHLRWSWLDESDLPELAALREATDYVDDPIERTDLTQLQGLFNTPEANPTRNGAVGRDQTGSVVAYAWGHPRVGEGELRYWLDWAVHPAWTYRSIGVACTTWLRDRGIAWWQEQQAAGIDEPLWLGAHVDEKLTRKLSQMESAGFVAERWFSDMRVWFAEHDPHELPLVVPEGIELVHFEPSLSEAVRAAHNRAFATVPGAQRISRSVWEHVLETTAADVASSWVALADGSVAGYAISSGQHSETDDALVEGWTEFLGTVPEWRGRGIARAVLTAALRGFADAGLAGAGLGVDADRAEAAFRLFTELGYRSSERLVLMGMRRG